MVARSQHYELPPYPARVASKNSVLNVLAAWTNFDNFLVFIEYFRVRLPPTIHLLKHVKNSIVRTLASGVLQIPPNPEIWGLSVIITTIGPHIYYFFAIILDLG
jgi:hypothetical protein